MNIPTINPEADEISAEDLAAAVAWLDELADMPATITVDEDEEEFSNEDWADFFAYCEEEYG